MNPAPLAIGIDFGTCFSCAGVWRNNRVEILVNDEGNRSTPSCVAFSGEERFIGEAAERQITINAKNTVLGVKKLIGKQYFDDKSDYWPFEIIEGRERQIIKVEYKGEKQFFAPEQIAGMIFSKLKKNAEITLQRNVEIAVIAVPACFTLAQHQAIRDAATLAGLNVLRIIHEAAAAALSYAVTKNSQVRERYVLLFSLGGGVLDVSIVKIEEGILDVMATSGDSNLGGIKFTERIVEYLRTDFESRFKINMFTDQRAVQKLWKACEQAKRILSSSCEACIEIDSLIEGINFKSTVSRTTFEDLNIDYFQKCMDLVQQVCAHARVSKSQVDEIVLVGGSTRIPKLQQMLGDFFNGKDPFYIVNPDETVAMGAAVWAAILMGKDCENLQKIVPLERTSYSLGIETIGYFTNKTITQLVIGPESVNNNGDMTVMIERNTTIPAKISQSFSTSTDNQTNIELLLYEGESGTASNNYLIGKFKLSGIPPMRRGQPQIDITFDIDANRILTVTAMLKDTSYSLTITSDHFHCQSGTYRRLSAEQMQAFAFMEKSFQEQDDINRRRVEAKNRLENFVIRAQSEASQVTLLSKLQSTLSWIQMHQSATEEEFDTKLKEVKDQLENLNSKVHFFEGEIVTYKDSRGQLSPAKITQIHYETHPPHFSVLMLETGREKDTEGTHLFKKDHFIPGEAVIYRDSIGRLSPAKIQEVHSTGQSMHFFIVLLNTGKEIDTEADSLIKDGMLDG